MTQQSQPPSPKLSFEDALAKLEEIVQQMEEGKVPLEESIEKYAAAQELIKQCRMILESAEKKIHILAKGQGDAMEISGQLEDVQGE